MTENFTRKEVVRVLQEYNIEINAMKYDLFGEGFNVPKGADAIMEASYGLTEMIRLRKEQIKFIRNWKGRIK
jgi:hypothetical protein